ADPLSDEEFRRAVGQLLSERLDHSRPLWRGGALPLPGSPPGVAAPVPHAPAGRGSAVPPAPGLLWDDEEAPKPGSATRKEEAKSPPPPRAPAPASSETRILVRIPSALWRELRPCEDSVLDQHIGSDREVAWTAFGLDRLKRIEHAAGEGITINDVVLAVGAGGLGSWIEHGDGRVHDLRVQVPVCLHAREENEGTLGNRDSFMNVDLPLAEPDPVARLRFINAETRERKVAHDADTLYAFFHAIGR